MSLWTPHRIGLLVGAAETRIFSSVHGPSTAGNGGLFAALQPMAGRRARLEVVLSDEHCRYAVLERPTGLRNRAELDAAIRGRFNAIFGDTGDWKLAASPAPRARRDFVAAVDGGVAGDVVRQCTDAGLRPVSVKPHWVAWARHFKQATRKGSHWIVAAGATWVSVGYLRAGECLHVRSQRRDPGLGSAGDLLARERAFVPGADPAAKVWLCGSAQDFQGPEGCAADTAGPQALWRPGNGRKA